MSTSPDKLVAILILVANGLIAIHPPDFKHARIEISFTWSDSGSYLRECAGRVLSRNFGLGWLDLGEYYLHDIELS
jgi:hypothetical protein